MSVRRAGGPRWRSRSACSTPRASSPWRPTRRPDEVEKLLHEALRADFGLFTLVDDKGRKVFVPAEKIAYVELGEPEARRVGFGG